MPKYSMATGTGATALPFTYSCTAKALLYTCTVRVWLPAGGATQLSTMRQLKGCAAAAGQRTGLPASVALTLDSHHALRWITMNYLFMPWLTNATVNNKNCATSNSCTAFLHQ